MCAHRTAKWLTNDIKINRFYVLNPGQKVIARVLVLDAIQAKPSVQYKDNYAWSVACGAEPLSHKHGVLTRVSVVSQTCWPQGDLDTAGPYLTIGLRTDLNIFQKQYRNKIQTELFWNHGGFFFVFNTKNALIVLVVLNWDKSLK